MRKISADYIFPIASEPIKNGIISVEEDGTIMEISAPSSNIPSTSDIHYEGIICPGFINTHCHLELSHMWAQVSEKAGMMQFIREILSKRASFSAKEIQNAIDEADAEMIKNGIVAVGDISNNNDTFLQKSKSPIAYHTFIEAFDFNPEKADETFANALALGQQLKALSHSIVPHAPYTVSEKLFKLISEEAIKKNSIISIHNQESLAESDLFISHSGPMFDAFSKMGMNMDAIPKTGVNSLRTTLPKLPLSQKILLVHNTFTSKEDLQWVKKILNPKSQMLNLFWCTCPNANLYIENKLPDYSIFIEENVSVTIGTDSLASNWSLSILDEIKTITKHAPQIPLQTLLTWATKNGAELLGMNQLGTLEKDKKPGLNLLKNVDGMKLTEKTEVVKLA
ncbi:MAG: amidohydrolase family protein [Bacteroidetes bacterium]|nr:amidohydrolase family protein [Bacteroidota bacterium]